MQLLLDNSCNIVVDNNECEDEGMWFDNNPIPLHNEREKNKKMIIITQAGF